MRYIKPPSHKQPKYIPTRNKPPEYKWIRLLLGLGTIAVLIVIFDIISK